MRFTLAASLVALASGYAAAQSSGIASEVSSALPSSVSGLDNVPTCLLCVYKRGCSW